jgi:hypothetical protein
VSPAGVAEHVPQRAAGCAGDYLVLRCGKIAGMAELAPDPKMLLREDLSKEYYAIWGASDLPDCGSL